MISLLRFWSRLFSKGVKCRAGSEKSPLSNHMTSVQGDQSSQFSQNSGVSWDEGFLAQKRRQSWANWDSWSLTFLWGSDRRTGDTPSSTAFSQAQCGGQGQQRGWQAGVGAASFLPLIVSLLRSELRAQPGPLAYTDVPILKLSPVKPERTSLHLVPSYMLCSS